MGNIWIALIPAIFAIIVFVGAITYYLIKKPNYYIPKAIVILCLILVMLYFYIPYFKDLADGQTTVVVARYDEFHRNSAAGTRKVIFYENEQRMELLVPGYSGMVGELQEDEVYEIEYFNNSKIIKTYRLIEQ